MLMSDEGDGKQSFSRKKCAKAKFLSAESLSDKKIELLKPRYSPPAILLKKSKTKSNFLAMFSSFLTKFKRIAADMMAPEFTIGL